MNAETPSAAESGGGAPLSFAENPSWDLSPEYDSFDDPRFLADRAKVDELVAALEALEPGISPAIEGAEALDPGKDGRLLELCRKAFALSDACAPLFGNLGTYVNCVSSVDGRDLRAREFKGILAALDARIDKAQSAFLLLLARASEAFAAAVVASGEGRAHAFQVGQLRKRRDELLPLAEEKTITSLVPDGLKAWGDLYNAISGTAKCRLATREGEREVGLAEAATLWRDPDPEVRKAAYEAQAEAFTRHEESLAAILNAIAGWRHAEYGLRSTKKPLHFLDRALSQSRITRATLDAMMSAVAESREIGREALRLQARLAGVPALAAWDILAPPPVAPGEEAAAYSFAEGLELVRGAYASVSEEMGGFVLEMRDRRRIEARVLPTKRPGAYCTRFAKSRTPMVFQTYKGSLADVSTLAHELGHAFHGKLLADLPLPETYYPMTLAETASTFAETALGDYLEGRAMDARSRLALGWSDAQDAGTFLLNIPARFDFERRFYEARAEKPLGPAALTDLTMAAWKEWYGDALANYDGNFWKSKLHFYMTGVSFYNFPYTFGYLFSLGVYAKRAELGADFPAAYAALLRDTGRMEAEELARKHLGADLEKPDFWRASVAIVAEKVGRFRTLVESLGR